MKNRILFSAVLAVLFFAAPIFQLHAQTQTGGQAQQSFENSREWNKLDPSLQQAWLDAKKANDMSRRFDCFVRVRAPADMGDEAFLNSNGFVVRQFAGSVATGHMKAGDLPDVAELPFVDSIKLSKPVGTGQ